MITIAKASKLGELLQLAGRWNDWPKESVDVLAGRLSGLAQSLLEETAALVLAAFRPDSCPEGLSSFDRVDGRALGPFTFWNTFMSFYRRVAENVPASEVAWEASVPSPEATTRLDEPGAMTREASASGPILLPWRGQESSGPAPTGDAPVLAVEFLLGIRGGYLLLNGRYPRREGHKIQAQPTARTRRLIAMVLLSHDGGLSTPELLDALECCASERSRIGSAVSKATNGRLKTRGNPAQFTEVVFLSADAATLAKQCFPGLATVDLSPYVAANLG
jgi:hypothetical protein